MEYLSGPIRATSFAVFQVLVLSSIGYFFARAGKLDRTSLKVISKLLTDIFLPAFIFFYTIKGFSSDMLKTWWLFPLLGLGIFGFSVVVATIVAQISRIKNKRLFIASVSFQNCGYMPLLMINALFPEGKVEILYTWVFLFILGFNLLVWSVGVILLTPGIKRTIKEMISKSINPPFIVTLVSIIVVITGVSSFLPSELMDLCEILSRPVLPLSMLVMGAILGLNCMSCNLDRKTLFLTVVTKLILLPVIGLIVLNTLPIGKMLRWFIMVELSVPSAVSLAVITEAYGGDTPFISQVLFYTHLFSLLTLPIFVGLGG